MVAFSIDSTSQTNMQRFLVVSGLIKENVKRIQEFSHYFQQLSFAEHVTQIHQTINSLFRHLIYILVQPDPLLVVYKMECEMVFIVHSTNDHFGVPDFIIMYIELFSSSMNWNLIFHLNVLNKHKIIKIQYCNITLKLVQDHNIPKQMAFHFLLGYLIVYLANIVELFDSI